MRRPSLRSAPRRYWPLGRTAATDATPPRVTAGVEPLFDEEMLARLRRLVLYSGRARAEGIAGEHRSRRRGASPEFADFKSYSQGDDFRRIDWNTYARLDGLFVRLSEVTTELGVHVLLDTSNSMDWRAASATPTKLTYAQRLTGAIGYVALWHFDRLTIVPFGDSSGHPFGPVQGRANIVPMLRYLEGLQPLGQTAIQATIERYARIRKRAGMLFLVSDLLSNDQAELRDGLRLLRSRGWHVIVMHVLDPAEVAPRLAANAFADASPGSQGAPAVELREVESGARLRLAATDSILSRYSSAFDTWLAETEAACQDEEAIYVRLQTDWRFDEVVIGLLHRRGVVA
ncbi:MAG: DUF58 domain-containing protein [Rhizobiales bacterium]|nr:DUF58 domain-containing protein [Hyphomicrobiales bacterium]